MYSEKCSLAVAIICMIAFAPTSVNAAECNNGEICRGRRVSYNSWMLKVCSKHRWVESERSCIADFTGGDCPEKWCPGFPR